MFIQHATNASPPLLTSRELDRSINHQRATEWLGRRPIARNMPGDTGGGRMSPPRSAWKMAEAGISAPTLAVEAALDGRFGYGRLAGEKGVGCGENMPFS